MNIVPSDRELDECIVEALVAYFRRGVVLPYDLVPRSHIYPTTPHLLELHWAFGKQVSLLTSRLLTRQGELSSSTFLTRVERLDQAAGSLLAAETMLRRKATGASTLFVFNDPLKSYDLPGNRLVSYVLERALRVLASYSNPGLLTETPYGESIRSGIDSILRARRILAARRIRALEERPTPRDLSHARRSRIVLHRLAADAYDRLVEIEGGRSPSLEGLLFDSLLAPLEQWRRFELFVLVRVAVLISKAVQEIPSLENITAVLQGPAIRVGELALYWGSKPKGMTVERDLTRMEVEIRALLSHYGYGPTSRRPDIVLVHEGRHEVLGIIECKYTDGEFDSDQQFRDAISQVVDYSLDYDAANHMRRLTASAVAMKRLPSLVEATHDRGSFSGGPSALSAYDLLRGETVTSDWIQKLLRATSPG